MALIRWTTPAQPMRDLIGIHDEMNRLMDGVFTPNDRHPQASFPITPAVDVEETPEGFTLRMDLPGVSQKDVKVSVLGDAVTIRGERRADTQASGSNLLRVERRFGSFERTFTLGTPVRADQVRAIVQDGVLEVQVPKAETARTREIEVQVG
jgi:HSP20 family protein